MASMSNETVVVSNTGADVLQTRLPSLVSAATVFFFFYLFVLLSQRVRRIFTQPVKKLDALPAFL